MSVIALKINGFELCVSESSYVDEFIGTFGRSVNGSLFTNSTSKNKHEVYEFTVPVRPGKEVKSIREYLLSTCNGDNMNFGADHFGYSSRGIEAVGIVGPVVGVFGTGADFVGGSIPNVDLGSDWTISYWYNSGPGFDHFSVRSDGVCYQNGVLAVDPLFVTVVGQDLILVDGAYDSISWHSSLLLDEWMGSYDLAKEEPPRPRLRIEGLVSGKEVYCICRSASVDLVSALDVDISAILSFTLETS